MRYTSKMLSEGGAYRTISFYLWHTSIPEKQQHNSKTNNKTTRRTQGQWLRAIVDFLMETIFDLSPKKSF